MADGKQGMLTSRENPGTPRAKNTLTDPGCLDGWMVDEQGPDPGQGIRTPPGNI